MRTNVYVDGMNLFYGCLKGTAFKWLDIEKLMQSLLPSNRIVTINYYTARVSSRGDVQRPVRQDVYLRAISSNPIVRVHTGTFMVTNVRMPLVDGTGTALVVKTEEKGSDVNLATHLVADAYERAAECFVVVSNDSDLAEPVRLLRSRLDVRVGLVSPRPRQSRVLLQTRPTFAKVIRSAALQRSQLPHVVPTRSGPVSRPLDW